MLSGPKGIPVTEFRPGIALDRMHFPLAEAEDTHTFKGYVPSLKPGQQLTSEFNYIVNKNKGVETGKFLLRIQDISTQQAILEYLKARGLEETNEEAIARVVNSPEETERFLRHYQLLNDEGKFNFGAYNKAPFDIYMAKQDYYDPGQNHLVGPTRENLSSTGAIKKLASFIRGIGLFIYHWARQKDSNKESRNAMCECIGSNVLSASNVPGVHQQALYEGAYTNGRVKFITVTKLQKGMQDFDITGTLGVNQNKIQEGKFNIRAVPDEKAFIAGARDNFHGVVCKRDPKTNRLVAPYDFGAHLPFMIALNDPDGVGSKGQNKGIYLDAQGDPHLFIFDTGQALRGENLILQMGLDMHFRFEKPPGNYKNYGIFYTTTLKEQMKGIYKMKRLKNGTLPPKEILEQYGSEFTKELLETIPGNDVAEFQRYREQLQASIESEKEKLTLDERTTLETFFPLLKDIHEITLEIERLKGLQMILEKKEKILKNTKPKPENFQEQMKGLKNEKKIRIQQVNILQKKQKEISKKIPKSVSKNQKNQQAYNRIHFFQESIAETHRAEERWTSARDKLLEQFTPLMRISPAGMELTDNLRKLCSTTSTHTDHDQPEMQIQLRHLNVHRENEIDWHITINADGNYELSYSPPNSTITIKREKREIQLSPLQFVQNFCRRYESGMIKAPQGLLFQDGKLIVPPDQLASTLDLFRESRIARHKHPGKPLYRATELEMQENALTTIVQRQGAQLAKTLKHYQTHVITTEGALHLLQLQQQEEAAALQRKTTHVSREESDIELQLDAASSTAMSALFLDGEEDIFGVPLAMDDDGETLSALAREEVPAPDASASIALDAPSTAHTLGTIHPTKEKTPAQQTPSLLTIALQLRDKQLQAPGDEASQPHRPFIKR